MDDNGNDISLTFHISSRPLILGGSPSINHAKAHVIIKLDGWSINNAKAHATVKKN